MIVLTIVFGTLFGNKDRTFPVYILTGRLLYTFYSSATKAALKSVRANSAMIKKVYVPKYLYPLSSVLFNYVIFLISLIVLVLIMYTCAIFYYPSRLLKSGFSWILKYNPLYCTIDVFRSGMFGEPMNLHYAAYALVFSLVTIAIGMFCFKKKQDEFILYI